MSSNNNRTGVVAPLHENRQDADGNNANMPLQNVVVIPSNSGQQTQAQAQQQYVQNQVQQQQQYVQQHQQHIQQQQQIQNSQQQIQGQQQMAMAPGQQMQMGPPTVLPSPQQMSQQPLLQQPVSGQQHMPMVIQPPQGIIVQQQPVYMDGNALLSQLNHIVIREKIRLIQVLVGWERPNMYQIEDKNGQVGHPLIFAEEKSGCFERQCCPNGVRGWEMNIKINGGVSGQIPYLHFKKPTACACCCYCRPVLEIFDSQNDYLVGTIENPFECCAMKYIIKDNNGVEVLQVRGHSCQPGMICRCPCGPCRNIEFEVTDINTGEQVGMIKKAWGGVMRDWISDAGLFEVEFGKVRHPQFKGLVVACALFLSEEYFTRGGQDQRDDSLLGVFSR